MAEKLSDSSTVFVEDNPYGELRFMGEDRPSMKNFLGESAVLLGSFSKIVAPGMRLGWICACEEIMEKLIIAKQASDLHSNYLCQRIIHQYLKNNDIERHIAKIRKAYKEQRDFMVQTMQETSLEDVSFTRPEGGMFSLGTLPDGMSSLDLFNRAIKERWPSCPARPSMQMEVAVTP